MPVSFSQYRGTIGMFNNIFANKRCSTNSICYHRKMQSCDFGSTMILFILLHAFPILIGFLKKIARQNMLMVHINKKCLINCFYLFLSWSYFYHIWLFLRLMYLSGDIDKNPFPKKESNIKNIYLFKDLTSAYLEHISTPVLQRMMTVYKYLDMI